MMRNIKLSFLIILCLLCMWAFIPQLSAKHYKYKHRSRSTALGINLNVGQRPNYVEYNYVTPVAPVAYSQPVAVMPYQPARAAAVVPYQPYVEQRVYYPTYYPTYYQERVVVEQPSRISIRPHFSFSYWKN